MPKKRNTGDGALYYLTDRKLWRGIVEAGTTLTGQRHRLYVHAKTQKACREKLEQLKEDLAKYGTPVNRKVTVAQWAGTWLEQSRREIDPKSFAASKSAVTKWIIPYLGSIKLRELRPSHVRELRSLMIDDGRASSTASRHLSVLNKMLNDAIHEKLLEDNPVPVATKTLVARAKKVKCSRSALTVDESMAILKVAASYPPSLASRFWFKLLSGQRQGEILGATLNELRLNEGAVSTYEVSWKLEELKWMHGCTPNCGNRWARMCPAKSLEIPDNFEYLHLDGRYYLTRPKSQEGRVFPILAPCAALLAQHLASSRDLPNPHGLIWCNDDGSPIDPKQDSNEWRQLLFDAGVISQEENRPGGTKLTGHVARHTVVTLLSALGVDAQLIGEIVGHSSVDVTALYRHANMAEKARAMNLLGEALQLEV